MVQHLEGIRRIVINPSIVKPPTFKALVQNIREYAAEKGHPIPDDMTEADVFFMWSESTLGDIDDILAGSDF
jgi:hypothetical protein